MAADNPLWAASLVVNTDNYVVGGLEVGLGVDDGVPPARLTQDPRPWLCCSALYSL